jgi:hypothetical protein
MKRLVLFLIVAAVAAAGIWYGSHRAATASRPAVASLLSKETVALLTVPDFNRMRDQWKQTDIYKIYLEPAVQDFLRKPLSKAPQAGNGSETLHDIEQLELRDGFIALASIENNNYSLVAGFRFRGSQANAEKIIGKWRAQSSSATTKRESVDYQGHKIDIAGEGANQIATVYNGDWFFAANDLEQLKILLDRADHRAPAAAASGLTTASPSAGGQDRQSTLEQDESFRAAMAHMPAGYAALVYVQPKSFADKLAALRAQVSKPLPPDQQTMLEQIRSVAGAMRFDGGKIHDWWFVCMPKQEQNEKLTRSAANLGTTDTIFYLATLLNVDRLAKLNEAGATPGSVWFQKAFNAAARMGLTANDWKAAFDLELGSLADWPAGGRWPNLIVTLPVKDLARADKVVSAFTAAIDEDLAWNKTEKDGVRYFSARWGFGNFIATMPTIALSKDRLIAGLDPTWVQEAVKRSQQSSSTFVNSASYKSAARALAEPTNFFGYIDLPLLYSRLDAALRPMLLMTAAFMPAISDNVDVTKLPPPEVITKHLSPIVSSQRYEGDGYVSESLGPITLSQAAVGVGLPAAFWFGFHPGGH